MGSIFGDLIGTNVANVIVSALGLISTIIVIWRQQHTKREVAEVKRATFTEDGKTIADVMVKHIDEVNNRGTE